jgi:hypothetical protein
LFKKYLNNESINTEYQWYKASKRISLADNNTIDDRRLAIAQKYPCYYSC